MQPHAVDEELVRRLERRVALLEAERQVARDPAPAGPTALGVRSVLVALGLIVAVAVLVALGYLAWKGISLVLIAVLFAVALNPAVEFFVVRGLARPCQGRVGYPPGRQSRPWP